MQNRAHKEKSNIKLSEGRTKLTPRADASIEANARVTLDADDFDRFEECMKKSPAPNARMQEAIELHKTFSLKA